MNDGSKIEETDSLSASTNGLL